MADVIKVQPSARIKLTKNSGVVLYDQQFAPSASAYTSHVGQAVLIAANTSSTLSIGGISAVRNVLLQADNQCTVKVNGQTSGVLLVGTNSVYAAYSTSLTAIKVVNASTTNTVTVQYVVSN
jgi:hypothetical protein